MIGKWLGRRYTKLMEDPKKVQAKIDELLKETGHRWTALSGNHALTKVNVKADEYEFRPDTGMPVKAFADLVTGEIKIFMFFLFEVDSK